MVIHDTEYLYWNHVSVNNTKLKRMTYKHDIDGNRTYDLLLQILITPFKSRNHHKQLYKIQESNGLASQKLLKFCVI